MLFLFWLESVVDVVGVVDGFVVSIIHVLLPLIQMRVEYVVVALGQTGLWFWLLFETQLKSMVSFC